MLLKKNNIVALAKQGGRLGWIIENEGFNYKLEHAYCNDDNAIKVY